jgi:hypothetical protein
VGIEVLPMHEKWNGRGSENRLGGPNLHAKRRWIGEESSKVMHKKKINMGGKLRKVTNIQHNHGNLTHMQKGNKRGEGIGVSRLAPHGRATINLGFNKPLRFDNQTLFCLVLRF